MSTVGFRWSWAWNDERGEWEFEKLNKITQYRHNINTSIKKRVILSFYNVSCSLSDTWFADKRKNIFFTRTVQPIFFFIFDLTFLWFLIFFDPNWVPCETCGGKILPVFRFARNLVQKKRARGSLLLSLLWRELENGKDFSAACFAGDPIWIEKIKNHKNVKSKMKKNIGWTCKKYIFSFIGKPSVR